MVTAGRPNEGKRLATVTLCENGQRRDRIYEAPEAGPAKIRSRVALRIVGDRLTVKPGEQILPGSIAVGGKSCRFSW